MQASKLSSAASKLVALLSTVSAAAVLSLLLSLYSLYKVSNSAFSVFLSNLLLIYHLFCIKVTVSDLWKEWTIDLKIYLPVQDLKDIYRTAWYLFSSKQVFFDHRKVIIDKIYKRQNSRINLLAAVEKLEVVHISKMKECTRFSVSYTLWICLFSGSESENESICRF